MNPAREIILYPASREAMNPRLQLINVAHRLSERDLVPNLKENVSYIMLGHRFEVVLESILEGSFARGGLQT